MPYLRVAVVPAGNRRAALAGRVSAHLNVVSPAGNRRRVTILNGAEECPTVDVLARLRDVAEATPFSAWRNARRIVQHIIGSATLVDRREIRVTGVQELR